MACGISSMNAYLVLEKGVKRISRVRYEHVQLSCDLIIWEMSGGSGSGAETFYSSETSLEATTSASFTLNELK